MSKEAKKGLPYHEDKSISKRTSNNQNPTKLTHTPSDEMQRHQNRTQPNENEDQVNNHLPKHKFV